MSNLEKQIAYWKTSADRNWETAQGLLKLKRYDACLFFCHLTLEKSLKGLVVKQTEKPVPYIHDLKKLAILAEAKLTDEQIENLRIISKFNMAERYDDIKFAFYKQCDKSYIEEYFNISKELYLCLKKEYQKE
ncbi:MAG: HEPN domain-containing protein [Candidatus Pacebacteria bacterium]|nr:HEPN domain-containing protein [Candidatus Paceibacterota bacterium]